MIMPIKVAKVAATTRTADKPSMTMGAKSSALYVAEYAIVNHLLGFFFCR